MCSFAAEKIHCGVSNCYSSVARDSAFPVVEFVLLMNYCCFFVDPFYSVTNPERCCCCCCCYCYCYCCCWYCYFAEDDDGSAIAGRSVWIERHIIRASRSKSVLLSLDTAEKLSLPRLMMVDCVWVSGERRERTSVLVWMERIANCRRSTLLRFRSPKRRVVAFNNY